MGELSKAHNIGAVAEAQLHEVGIDTLEELKRVGVKKTMLPEERRAELRQFYDWHKGDGAWGKQ